MPHSGMDEERCEELLAQILKYSDADETELLLGGGTSQLTRFANNTIHQNVAEEGTMLSVRTVYDGRTARATTNKFDAENLRRLTVGDYRVIYGIEQSLLKVTIELVRHRSLGYAFLAAFAISVRSRYSR